MDKKNLGKLYEFAWAERGELDEAKKTFPRRYQVDDGHGGHDYKYDTIEMDKWFKENFGEEMV